MALLVLLLGLLTGWYALRLGLAASFAQQGEQFLSHWQAQRTAPKAEAWAVAQHAAERANALYPGDHTAYRQLSGRIARWRSYGDYRRTPEIMADWRAALADYEQAVAAAPLWPFAWVDLASAKLMLREYDARLAEALQQAQRLGPWRLRVNTAVARIGLQAWPRLDASTRQVVLTAAERAILVNPRSAKSLLALAERRGRRGVLCNGLPADLLQAQRLCP